MTNETRASTNLEAPAPPLSRLAATAGAMLALLTVVTGVLYPLGVTGVARAAFPEQRSGSLVREGDRVVGSRLVGQPVEDPRYFWGRLSATTPGPFNAGASAGSNLGPTNPALTNNARARIEALRALDPGNRELVPVDLVTSSASGLDPHITPAAALYQARRVARTRGLADEHVRELVTRRTEPRTLGVLGEPRVNVLLLNLDLDREH